MPMAAPRPCTYPGCNELVRGGGRCARHVSQVRQEQDEQRGSARERGYTRAWEKARAAWLRKHPLCQCDECDDGRKAITPATVVDHRIPHKGDMRLFWDSSNWQSMAQACHNRKTAREDGGFGRERLRPGGRQISGPSSTGPQR